MLLVYVNALVKHSTQPKVEIFTNIKIVFRRWYFELVGCFILDR